MRHQSSSRNQHVEPSSDVASDYGPFLRDLIGGFSPARSIRDGDFVNGSSGSALDLVRL